METSNNKVKLNVGGRIFETTTTTLEFAGRDSLFRAMLDENWNLHSDSSITEHFIDRNPDCFGVLLDLLRTGEFYIPPKIDKRLLYKEAEYYGILDHVWSAECDKFDGNRPRLARSITGWSVRDGPVCRSIQASQSGWCCVAHGSMVHVYDWMLEERPTINLDYHKVNDVCWVDSKNVVVSSDKKLDRGGMGLFNASTGELRYKFQVTDVLKGYTAGALGVSSDNKLFSSCNTSNGHGIGVWDYVTGMQINFLHRSPYRRQRNASRLQWLHGTNCLMIASFDPRNDISLFDFRKNNVVWSWSGSYPYTKPCITLQTTEELTDAIAIEEHSSICVVDWNECLGFMDFRSTNASVNRRDSIKGIKPFLCENDMINIGSPQREYCYPKLAFHGGQLFSSLSDTISVYSGSDWVPTSQFRQSHGGPIWDFSIGGDRLFALHTNEDILDVWETPRSPII